MLFLPFIILGLGVVLGVLFKNKNISIYSEKLSSFSLILLMLTIGLEIGVNPSIIKNFGKIGINSIIIAFLGILFSIFFAFILEKTILPLKKLDESLKSSYSSNFPTDEIQDNSLVVILPLTVLAGIVLGIFFQGSLKHDSIGSFLNFFLLILFLCVGISLGVDIKMFKFFKLVGVKVLFLPLSITLGSIFGGFIAGFILDIPLNVSMLSASGMGYYSLTGAFMSSNLGVEYGTYGFIVNIIREISTVLFLPLFLKIGTSAPIACGGATTMDTMLVPITKAIGARLGIVTLLSGTILTFIVPFLLPFLNSILR